MSSDTREVVAPEADDPRPRSSGYKWAVLINTTIGTLMATIDSSIVLISLPAIFRGINMNPLTGGFLIAGPVSGWLSDRFGARPFATGGMVASAVTFGLLMLLPVNFSYGWFAALLLVNGLSNGLFAAPNTSSIMNSVPASRRGVASGMRSTFQNAGMTLSIGLFFTIMVAGLTSSLHASLTHGLTGAGLSSAAAAKIANLPPVSVLFAAFLGYNPMQMLLGPAIGTLPPARQAVVTGHEFFPGLISGPFHQGLAVVFTFALVVCLIAAAASWLHGSTVPGETPEPSADVTPHLTTEPLRGHQCPLPAASPYCPLTSARLRSRSSPLVTLTLIR